MFLFKSTNSAVHSRQCSYCHVSNSSAQMSPAICSRAETTLKSVFSSETRGGSCRRAAALPEKCKAKDSDKLALSLDLVTKISQHNRFRYSRHHFCSTFPGNSTKPMFRCFPTTPLTYAMTFSAHLPMNLAISGLS